ncbi:hypothetical protein ELQ88_28545 [Pseudomonas sp. MPC6]|nr:hypothetical protein ELQ88_28545 [Pseudomonas sp. MPC6]
MQRFGIGNSRRISNPISTEDPCRSWLASECCVSVNFVVAYEIAFAGKPAPTGSPTFNEQRTDRFPRMKPSAKVRGFQFLLRSKAWHDRTE